LILFLFEGLTLEKEKKGRRENPFFEACGERPRIIERFFHPLDIGRFTFDLEAFRKIKADRFAQGFEADEDSPEIAADGASVFPIIVLAFASWFVQQETL